MFALVAGLLGPVQQAIETTESLIARFQAYQNTPRNLIEILSAYKQFHEDVSILHDQLNSTHTIAPKNRPIVESRILKSAQLVNNGTETLVQMQQKLSNAGRLRRFFRAFSHDRVLSGLQDDLEKANDNLLIITTLLCTTHAVESLSDKLRSQQSSSQDHQGDVTRSMSRLSLNPPSARSANVVIKDDDHPVKFQPSFHVPRNPSHVCLDFDAINSNNSPASIEGRVKFLACLDHQEAMNTSNIVSIVGMSGTGKTCTLRALAFHQDVRNRFPDGIYYISMGIEATESHFSSALCDVITRVVAQADHAKFLQYTVDELLMFLSKLFQGRTFALLVDDVQPTAPLGAQVIDSIADWLTVGNKSCMVFTTQDRNVALKGRVVNFSPRDPMGETSKLILARCAQFDLDEVQVEQITDHFNKALSICAGLPLALAIVGRAVLSLSLSLGDEQGNKAWERYLVSREEQPTDGRDVFGSVEGYRGLYTTLYTSLTALDSNTEGLTFQPSMSYKDMFMSLYILVRKDWAPYAMLRRLWGLENDQQAKEIASRFTYASLADVQFVEVEGKEVEGITLHDLIHNFLVHERAKVDENPATRLLHSYTYNYCNGAEVPEVDCNLYGTNCRGFRQWWLSALPDDGYFHDHILINLFWSGRHIELYLLAINPRWHMRRLQFGHLACEKDIDLVRRIMDAELLVAFEDCRNEAVDFISQFQSAMRLTMPYIQQNVHEAPFQVEARLWKPSSERSIMHEFWSHIMFGICERPMLIPRTPSITGCDTPLRTIIPFSESVLAMGIPPNLNFVACGLNNGEAKIIHHELQIQLSSWKAHEGGVYSVSYILQPVPPATDDVLLITSSLDTTVKLWNVKSTIPELLRIYDGHCGSVPCVRQIPGSTNVISVSSDRTFHKWDYNTGEKQFEVMFDDDEEISDFAILGKCEEEGRVVTATHRRIFTWSTQTGSVLSQFEVGSNGLPLRITPFDNSNKVVLAFREGFLSVWDIEKKIQCGDEFCEHDRLVLAVTELKNGKQGHEGIVVSSASDKKIRFWNIDTKEEICESLSGHASTCFQLYADERVNKLWSCASDGFRVWDLEKVLRQDRKDHCQKVETLAISEDGNVVLCGFRDGKVKVWGYVNNGWEVTGILIRHESWVTGLATIHGDFVVSVSEDRTLRFWDVKRRTQLGCWQGLTALTRTVLVSRHYLTAITGSKDGTVLVWNLRDNGEDSLGVVHVMKADGFIRRLHMFDREEQAVVSVTIEGCCQVWRLSDGSLMKETTVNFGTDATLEEKRSIIQSRDKLLTLMGESVDRNVGDGSVAVHGNKIMWCDDERNLTLGTLESPVHDWVYSKAHETLFAAAMNWNLVIADILTDEHDLLS